MKSEQKRSKRPIPRTPPTEEELEKSRIDGEKVQARFNKANRLAMGAMVEVLIHDEGENAPQ